MSNYDFSDSADTLRLHPEHGSDAKQQAALRAVLLRVDRGQLTHTEACTILQALGMADTPEPAKAPRPSTRQRAQAEKRDQREAS